MNHKAKLTTRQQILRDPETGSAELLRDISELQKKDTPGEITQFAKKYTQQTQKEQKNRQQETPLEYKHIQEQLLKKQKEMPKRPETTKPETASKKYHNAGNGKNVQTK